MTAPYDWQSLVAVSVVLVTALVLVTGFVRRLRSSPKGGCGGGCGCVKTELRGK
jgi:hypothetical protein